MTHRGSHGNHHKASAIAAAIALAATTACLAEDEVAGPADADAPAEQVQSAPAPAPAMPAFCDGDEGLAGLDGFLGFSVTSTCNQQAQDNAWSFVGKDFDDWVAAPDRAGLLARADLDYCLLRELDGAQLEDATSVRYLGRFGVQQEIHIYEADPDPDNRHVRGYRDLYIYLFGVKASLQRQTFEVRFPRNDYPEWRIVQVPRFDPWSGAVSYSAEWMQLANHSTFLMGRGADGRRSVTIDIPIVGELIHARLDDTERQALEASADSMWDWQWFPSFWDRLAGTNAATMPLAGYTSAAFPDPWTGGWYGDVGDVHQDYTGATGARGVVQKLAWSARETFSGTGVLDAGAGAVISAMTGVSIPSWIDDLLSLVEVEIQLGVGFGPGAALALANYVTTPPFVHGPDVSVEANTDVIRDHVELDARVDFDVDPVLDITVRLNLWFWHPSWTWHLVSGGTVSSRHALLAEAQTRVSRQALQDGAAVAYDWVRLNTTGEVFHGAAAEEWVAECLSEPGRYDEPAPPRDPELTPDVPRAPRICIVDAACEGEVPYIRMCLCDDAGNVDLAQCRDTLGMDRDGLARLGDVVGADCRP